MITNYFDVKEVPHDLIYKWIDCFKLLPVMNKEIFISDGELKLYYFKRQAVLDLSYISTVK